MEKTNRTDPLISCSSFATRTGAQEHFLAISSKPGWKYADALEDLDRAYDRALKQRRLSPDTQVFVRFYVSDITNQKDALVNSAIYRKTCAGACSVIHQSPLKGGPMAMLAYHIKGAVTREPLAPADGQAGTSVLVKGANYRALFTGEMGGPGPFDSEQQTEGIWRSFLPVLERHGMTLLDNTIRTWIFVRDVDNHYKGMVKARRAVFEQHGLTQHSRYCASTGIEGRMRDPGTLVSMDTLSFAPLRKEQIVRMEALDHLPPTITYGVTFERGLRVRFGDRSHLYISGTASIDKDGAVLHPGNVENQARRTIENIKALLSPHGATLEDMMYILVFLRDPNARNRVAAILKREVPRTVPLLMVGACVCRPAWLFEMEGMAIIKDTCGFPAFL
jgi:enamine deaminase RidA (YjgF/YER057c/UK114 family)